MPRGGSSFTVCFSLPFFGVNDITGILKQKFLVRVRSPFFGRHGHSFLPIWLKFGMKVAYFNFKPSCFLQKCQIQVIKCQKSPKT